MIIDHQSSSDQRHLILSVLCLVTHQTFRLENISFHNINMEDVSYVSPDNLGCSIAEPSEPMSRWWLQVILTVRCQDVKYKHHYDNPGQCGHTKIFIKMETFQ